MFMMFSVFCLVFKCKCLKCLNSRFIYLSCFLWSLWLKQKLSANGLRKTKLIQRENKLSYSIDIFVFVLSVNLILLRLYFFYIKQIYLDLRMFKYLYRKTRQKYWDTDNFSLCMQHLMQELDEVFSVLI